MTVKAADDTDSDQTSASVFVIRLELGSESTTNDLTADFLSVKRVLKQPPTHPHTHPPTHTHVGFLWFTGTFHRRNGFLYCTNCMCYALHLQPKLSPHRRWCISIFPQKNSLCMIYKRFNYGDTEMSLINHLLLVIPMSYPCHYTHWCPHNHINMRTHTHTHTSLRLSLVVRLSYCSTGILTYFWQLKLFLLCKEFKIMTFKIVYSVQKSRRRGLRRVTLLIRRALHHFTTFWGQLRTAVHINEKMNLHLFFIYELSKICYGYK